MAQAGIMEITIMTTPLITRGGKDTIMAGPIIGAIITMIMIITDMVIMAEVDTTTGAAVIITKR
jgi:hypothetical protein